MATTLAPSAPAPAAAVGYNTETYRRPMTLGTNWFRMAFSTTVANRLIARFSPAKVGEASSGCGWVVGIIVALGTRAH